VPRIIDKADPDDPFLIYDALDDGVGRSRVVAYLKLFGPDRRER
jgi:hypothetical protein